LQYRQFGRMDWQVSALGYGCARLPTLGGEAQVDEPRAIALIRRAIEGGVNYLDTAYIYHGGQSEIVIGKALADGYRQHVKVATKLYLYRVSSIADADRMLDEQMRRLQVDHIDMYLFHDVRRARWDMVQRLGLLEWMEKQQARGRIGVTGFSFHDELDVFKAVVDGYDKWATCVVLYNYMDLTRQAGMEGVRYAAARGIAVAAMEPLLGGALVDPPPEVQAVWDAAESRRTAADWGMQWLWHQSQVAVALSGMSTMQQVEENLASADRSAVGSLSSADVAAVERVRSEYYRLRQVPCSTCSYCLPCPNGVNIPRVFEIYNYGYIHKRPGDARYQYSELPEETRAGACTGCRACESLCTQGLPISELMPRVESVLGHGEDYPRL
jgi:uncharacterized protein